MVLEAYFGLFCVAAFAATPAIIRGFITLQVKAGNGELLLIKWLQTRERTAVYCVWRFFAAGLDIASLMAKEHIMNQLE
mgnify:CR=1 FL=1